VRPVGADEVGRAHRVLAGMVRQRRGHAVGILLEARDAYAALHLHAVPRELVTQNRFRRVLRNRDEAERNVVGQRHVELCHPFTVDVNDLATHQDGRVEDAAEHSHALEDLKCPRLYPNGFRILRRFGKRVDDAACDAAPGELDGGSHSDRTRAGDQYLRI